jgi:outer membrane protein
MKYGRFFQVVVWLAAMCFAGGVYAKDVKIGFIDSEKIFAKYKGTQDAQKKFDDIQTKWKEDAEKKQKELLTLKDELENQSLLLSDEKKKEKAALIEKKYAEYQEFVNSIWGANGTAYRKNSEMTKPIMAKINIILKKIGDDEKYTLIFDAAQGSIVYSEPGHDLTDRVIEELNKETD